jgi:hypothetical protein
LGDISQVCGDALIEHDNAVTGRSEVGEERKRMGGIEVENKEQ